MMDEEIIKNITEMLYMEENLDSNTIHDIVDVMLKERGILSSQRKEYFTEQMEPREIEDSYFLEEI